MCILKKCAARIMELGFLLLVTAFVLSDAVSMKSQAYFNRTASLPCLSSKAQNLSLSELIVFWQDQKNLVLYEHFLGKEKFKSVNAEYLGRTSFDEGDWVLRLHNAQIKDMGVYTCYVQKKRHGETSIIHRTDTRLTVVANFSEPKIELAQNVTRDSGINLTCSSKQGYPKPTKMYILISNSTEKHGEDMQISPDNVTELFDVSIRLSLPFPDGVYNVTVLCVLETESMNITSRPHNLETKMESKGEEETEERRQKPWQLKALLRYCPQKPAQCLVYLNIPGDQSSANMTQWGCPFLHPY
ncbi:T-lymphocyte activation antigen CD86 [Acomys russatus]|uniref:T-lymphocyte activation antigen CD86 n=1 Tax=Acomys russatus TaxID=60746 RepID=UPI0021E2FB7B|nr:T-lymphocyte activation antigen CD86 [Acomys russatus]